jgi:hypothetical protein
MGRMMWDTYTPDGRLLVLRRAEDGWIATCLSRRAEAPTAEEAIREAIGVESPPGDAELEAWIAEHAAALESA